MTDFAALNRIELADLHQPKRIVQKVHDLLGTIEGPVPVVQIAKALDVSQVKLDVFDGVEGMLLTDGRRSDGIILANTLNGGRRARFTVAHELGHFLMERHRPSDANGFRCTPSDMRERREARRHQRQETEANRFAIELLAPLSKLEPHTSGDPDLDHVRVLSQGLDLSLEATARRYRELHESQVAMVFHRNGVIRYPDRSDSFPYLMPQKGSPVPGIQPGAAAGTLTGIIEADPKDWFDGPPLGELWIQSLYQNNGYGITMLTLEADDHDDSGPEDTYDRYARWG